VALETGFSDHSHLTREFTRSLGEPPGVYRKRYR
jgi:AraC-like DNA-binding protein